MTDFDLKLPEFPDTRDQSGWQRKRSFGILPAWG